MIGWRCHAMTRIDSFNKRYDDVLQLHSPTMPDTKLHIRLRVLISTEPTKQIGGRNGR